jgi:hypothetical protein
VVGERKKHWASEAVACSECGAAINQPCIDTSLEQFRRLPKNTVHVTRVAANGHNILI